VKPILLVDDEPEQLRSLRVGLTTKGFVTLGVSSAQEAIRCLEQEPDRFGLVLTDYAMPDINGLELLEKVKTISPIPVIMMTAFGEKSLVIKALRFGCNGFIEKPFTLEQVSEEIWRVEEKKQLNVKKGIDSEFFPAHLHQLNNHLLSIQARAELSMRSLNDLNLVNSNLKAILEASKKISEINRRILQLEHCSRSNKERIDIIEFLDSCLNTYEIVMQKIGVVLEKNYKGFFGAVSGDRFSLEQVFSNLILNALQAMEGSPEKVFRVTAGPAGEPDFASIIFHDTGCGISEQFLLEIFKPYVSFKKNGNGLGLHVVQAIVKNHGGRVTVESEVERGTAFIVNLPLLPGR